MKNPLLIATLLFITVEVNAQKLPSWYFTQVESTLEKTVYIGTDGGEGTEYLDCTYTACDYIPISENIRSLDEAKKVAVEKAFYKIAGVVDSASQNEIKLLRCFYDESPKSAGVCVQISFTERKNAEPKTNASRSDLDRLRENSFPLDRIQTLKKTKYSLCAVGDFLSKEKSKRFGIKLDDKVQAAFSNSVPVKLKYPNGMPVEDNVVTFGDGDFKFVFKNCIKRQPSLVVIRADMASEADQITLVYKDVEAVQKIEHDENHRWKNLVFEFESGLLNEYSPEFVLKTHGKSISIASFYIYQSL